MTEIHVDTKNNSPQDVHTSGGNNSHKAHSGTEPSTKRSYAACYQVDDGYNATKRSRPQAIEMRCLVPAKSAGGIIGKGGSNIKDMRATFKAQIQLPDAQAPVRIFKVTASLETLGEILLRVVPIIHEHANRESEKMSLKLLVHQSQVGGIIGPKGFKITELRKKSGAIIKLHENCLPNSTDRTCEVSGSPDVISKCVVSILDMLQDVPVKGAITNYDPSFAEVYGDNNDNYRNNSYMPNFKRRPRVNRF